MSQTGTNDYDVDDGIQLATLAESQRELSQVPLATTVTTTIPQATIVRNTPGGQTAAWGEQVQGLPPVEPPALHYTENEANRTTRSDSEVCTEDCADTMTNIICTLVLFASVGGVIYATTTGDSNSQGSPTPFPTRRPPTPFPTTPPVGISPSTVVNCPAAFFPANGFLVSQSLTSCTSNGCGGSVVWCGLDDNKTYGLVIDARGDFDLLSETITLNYDGRSVETSAARQCDREYETILTDSVTSSAGQLSFTYQTSSQVTALCFGISIAADLRVLLVEPI